MVERVNKYRNECKVFNNSILNSILIHVKNNESVDEQMLNLFWDKAEKGENNNLLEAIANRKKLPDSIKDKILKRKDIDILVSYLSREDISDDELKNMLKNESRAGVLSGVLKKLDEDIFLKHKDVFKDHYENKPTKSVGQSLLNKHNSIDGLFAKILVCSLSDKFETLSDENKRNYRNLVNKTIDKKIYINDLALSFTEDLINLYLSDILEHDNLSQEIVEKITNIIFTDFCNKISFYNITDSKSNIFNRIVYALESNIDRVINSNQIDVMKKIVEISDKNTNILSNSPSIIDKINVIKNKLSSDNNEELSLAEMGEKDEVLNLLEKLDKGHTITSKKDIVTKLLNNSNLDSIVEKITEYQDVLLNKEYFDTNIKKYTEKLILELYIQNYEDMINIDNFASLGGEKLGEEKLIRYFIERYFKNISDSYHNYRIRSFGSTLIENIRDEKNIEIFPWEYLTELLESRYYIGEDIKKVSKVISETICKYVDEGGSWETFNVLSDGFQGTLGELKEASLKI